MTVPFPFTPTPASIPPARVVYRLKEPPNASITTHPLVGA